MRIDAHHHFWKYDPKEYGWINDRMAVIRRDFLAADLRKELQAAKLDGAVSVQARETLEETRWLLEIASKESIIKGVVGWVPLKDPGVERILEQLAANPKLKGLRHVLQDEPADQLMEDPAFNAGVERLHRHGLVYDLLIYERHLKRAIAFVDRHPNTVIVLDHIAKPKIAAAEMEPWRTQIRELARREHVYCKVSGMVTEADWQKWTPANLKPYLDTVAEAFSPSRLMFGSDWPVILVASSYPRWVQTVQDAYSRFSAGEQLRFWGDTAKQVYRL